MKIGFNGVNGTSSVQPKLEAWKIHDVTFEGVEFGSFTGKKDPSATYQVMRIKFKGVDGGVYEETVFCPKDGDEVRTVNGERENPSNLERFTHLMAHLGEQLAPERYKTFSTRQYDLPKEFEKMVNDFNTTLKPAIGKKTKLKLIGNKKNEPMLPYFVNINRDHEAYLSNNFVGDKVFFSAYETSQMDKRSSAKPTDMGSVVKNEDLSVDVAPAVENDDLNFEV